MNNSGYLYETHLHTCEGSACGASSGAEMARALASAGYAGAFVTDHFFNGNCAVDRSLPWEERCRRFAKGWESCRDEGTRLGLRIFFGFEWNWHGPELLVYGLTPAWLIGHPDCDLADPDAFAAMAHADGAFLVQAHPFREASYIRRTILFPSLVDAVEVRNGNKKHRENPVMDQKAADYARMFGFPGTEGTDVHCAVGVDGMGVRLAAPLQSPAEYAQRLREGAYTLAL